MHKCFELFVLIILIWKQTRTFFFFSFLLNYENISSVEHVFNPFHDLFRIFVEMAFDWNKRSYQQALWQICKLRRKESHRGISSSQAKVEVTNEGRQPFTPKEEVTLLADPQLKEDLKSASSQLDAIAKVEISFACIPYLWAVVGRLHRGSPSDYELYYKFIYDGGWKSHIYLCWISVSTELKKSQTLYFHGGFVSLNDVWNLATNKQYTENTYKNTWSTHKIYIIIIIKPYR